MTVIVNSRFLNCKITGVQRYATEISICLKNICKDIQFVTSRNIMQPEFAKRLKADTCGSLTGHLWEQTELVRHLNRQKNPLLINMANTAPLFYKNKITTIHDLAFIRHPEWFSKKFYYLYKFLIPQIAKNSLKIITVSEFSKREIIELLGISENKIEVVYNAVSDNFADLSRQTPIINKYGDYILAVSSLDPRKNFKNLILAFNKLNSKNINLVIVGSENSLYADQELKSLVESGRNIIFTGYASDSELVNLYKNAKLFVYSSLYEGFGIPPLEAMSCGCPVAASNIPSITEICDDATHYIDPYSVDSIARGIQEVLMSPKNQEELRQRGFARLKLFSWKKSAEKYLAIIQNI